MGRCGWWGWTEDGDAAGLWHGHLGWDRRQDGSASEASRKQAAHGAGDGADRLGS